MIKGLDHIGIAVWSVDEALKGFRDGLGMECTEIVQHQGMRIAFLRVGETTLELLEDHDPESPIGKFLASRGEGIHHLSFEVDDIRRALGEVRERGIGTVHDEPVMGAEGYPIAFLHPRGTHGVLLEFCEKPS